MVKIVSSPELEHALATLHRASSGTQDAMRQNAIDAVNRTWGPALASAAGTAAERKLLATGASADVDAGSMTLHAAKGPALTGGLANDGWAAIELGMDPKRIEAPNRRKTITLNGRPFRARTFVWVGRNLKPRNPDGYVIFPTVRKHGPRFVAAWIYGLIDVFRGSPFDIRKG